MKSVSAILTKERARLLKAKASVSAKIDALTKELEGYEAEINAILAYESAKPGKPTRRPNAPRRQTLKQAVFALLKNKPDQTRANLIEALHIKGVRGKEQSLSNLLSLLTKEKPNQAKQRQVQPDVAEFFSAMEA